MSSRLKILSYNIHKGFNTGNRRFVLPQIREQLAQSEADVVFLQEVIGEHSEFSETVPDWPSQTQYEYLAGDAWPHIIYGKNRVYRAGHHGNAILSKHPVMRWENIDISASRFEKRGLLHAVIRPEGSDIDVHCFNIHFGLQNRIRKIQLGRLCDRVSKKVHGFEPVIIAGDFNDWGGKASPVIAEHIQAHEIFEALNGKRVRTFPSWLPLLKLDRIYIRGFLPNDAKVLRGGQWIGLSDHSAIFADMRLI